MWVDYALETLSNITRPLRTIYQDFSALIMPLMITINGVVNLEGKRWESQPRAAFYRDEELPRLHLPTRFQEINTSQHDNENNLHVDYAA